MVCRSCERWNLTPIEERWEAVEECERAFELTRLRVSTDHIGLARLKEGLELVRIGEPKRPEFAAWRYGDQFGKRRRKKFLTVAGGVVILGAVAAGQATFGFAVGGISLINIANPLWSAYRVRRTVTVVNAYGRLVPVSPVQIDSTQLIWARSHNEISVLLPLRQKLPFTKRTDRIVVSPEAEDFLRKSGRSDERIIELQGDEARRGLAKILARVNSGGGLPKTVQAGVMAIEDAGTPDLFLRKTFKMFAANRSLLDLSAPKYGGNLKAIPTELRLGMEMAANEEHERRALESELAVLAEEWRAAEEIAAIADQLFISSDVQTRLELLKDKNRNR